MKKDYVQPSVKLFDICMEERIAATCYTNQGYFVQPDVCPPNGEDYTEVEMGS